MRRFGLAATWRRAMASAPRYFRGRGDGAGALADLTAAIKSAPNDPTLRLERAQYYWQLCQYDKAMADTDAAIAADRKFAFAFETRGALLVTQGDTEKGLQDVAVAVRLKPDDLAAKFDDRPKASISQADMAHGHRQVARMLRDRPEMGRYGESGPLTEWAAQICGRGPGPADLLGSTTAAVIRLWGKPKLCRGWRYDHSCQQYRSLRKGQDMPAAFRRLVGGGRL